MQTAKSGRHSEQPKCSPQGNGEPWKVLGRGVIPLMCVSVGSFWPLNGECLEGLLTVPNKQEMESPLLTPGPGIPEISKPVGCLFFTSGLPSSCPPVGSPLTECSWGRGRAGDTLGAPQIPPWELPKSLPGSSHTQDSPQWGMERSPVHGHTQSYCKTHVPSRLPQRCWQVPTHR